MFSQLRERERISEPCLPAQLADAEDAWPRVLLPPHGPDMALGEGKAGIQLRDTVLSLLGLQWESSPPGEPWSFLRASGRMRSPNPIFLSPPAFCHAQSTGEGPSSQGIPEPRRRPSGLPDLIG